MNRKSRKKIPVNLVAGPLGVGKTTTINHLLAGRPDGEEWAVLVNEYGLVGLDAALIEPTGEPDRRPGVEIREVTGGCICCSAGFMFEVSLVLLLQRRPDRLLIEPTGLAAVSGILDTLDRPGIREAVDVRSILCLLDPGGLDEALLRDEVQDQIEAADVLLASRPDLASAEDLEAFDAWARSLFPAKRFVGHVEQGRVEASLLDLAADRSAAAPRGGHRHGTDHDHDHSQPADLDDLKTDAAAAEEAADPPCDADRPIVQRSHRSKVASTIGWICWDQLVFNSQRISLCLRGLARLPGAQRAKAVLRTDEGWWAFNYANGIEWVRPSSYRRDSRLEVVIEGGEYPDTDAIEREIRA
ncbi:MAG: GTP-binding protein, partial [Acidobacteriota bacterium]